MKYFRLFSVLSLLLLSCLPLAAQQKLLVFGDSISTAYGLDNPNLGWVSLLQQRLIADKLDIRVINASISGETTEGGKQRLSAVLTRHQPDIVILELGGNDGLRGFPLARIKANLKTMLELLEANDSKIFLAGMRIPPNYGKQYTERFWKIYHGLAEEHELTLMPFILEPIAGKNEFIQADRIHPNAAAQVFILDYVYDYLQESSN